MQDIIDAISVLVLSSVLVASLRITLHHRFYKPQSWLLHIMLHPASCLTLVLFIPWTIAGFAKGEISYLPWQAFADHSGNGLLDATAFFLCVLVVDMWMFFTAGQLAVKVVSRSTKLSESEKTSDCLFYTVVNLLAGVLIVMQANNLYVIFQHVNNTTIYFVTGIALLGVYFHARFSHYTISRAPAILTTCGILGTFLGVAVGLMDFNPSDVQHSVPALIDGIKTAFWSSACGVFFALTIKLREVFFGGRLPKAKSRATIDDMTAIMEQARQDSNMRLEALVQLMETSVGQQQPQVLKPKKMIESNGAMEPNGVHKKISLAV